MFAKQINSSIYVNHTYSSHILPLKAVVLHIYSSCDYFRQKWRGWNKKQHSVRESLKWYRIHILECSLFSANIRSKR